MHRDVQETVAFGWGGRVYCFGMRFEFDYGADVFAIQINCSL